jgi:hypothetical protein
MAARSRSRAALGRELHDMIQEVKRTDSEIRESSDLWELEHYLTERREQIDRKYDYRYSQLMLVLGIVLLQTPLLDIMGRNSGKIRPGSPIDCRSSDSECRIAGFA